jgi:tRNA-dihydrouridine synthase B
MSQSPFLYLAPLRGITDVLFRNVYVRHFGGFSCAVAPFLNPQSGRSAKNGMFTDLLPEKNQLLPIIPQLLNNTADGFLALAERLEDLGYTQLNWNLGCPAPMVANKGRGSGLLPYPDEILGLLDTVLPKLRSSLSIKMRLGFRSREEGFALLPRLDGYPLGEIIIHPRLGKQLYSGIPDLDGFRRCLDLTRHHVVYNGDITTVTVYQKLAERFPAISRWMIGRGVLADPFLAEAITGMAIGKKEEILQRIRLFHDDLYTGYQEQLEGPGHLLGRMKQLWLYLIFSFPEQGKILKKIKKASTEQQYREAIDQLFEEGCAGSDRRQLQDKASFFGRI